MSGPWAGGSALPKKPPPFRRPTPPLYEGDPPAPTAPAPLARLVRAALSEEQAAVAAAAAAPDWKAGESESETLDVLTSDEARLSGSVVDLALGFGRSTDGGRLAESLALVLARFPSCSGRLVRRDVRAAEPGQGPVVTPRICILRCNAGVYLSIREADCPTPSVTSGPVASWCFDRLADFGPGAAGAPGHGPLLRATVWSFADGGQILTMSFSRALFDVGGAAIFLRSWAALHRCEDLPTVSPYTRMGFEAAIRSIRPLLHADFPLLTQQPEPGKTASRPVPEEPVVASVALRGAALEAFLSEFSARCRKKRLIFNSDVLTPAEASLGAIVEETFTDNQHVSMVVDYRDAFAVELSGTRHIGNATSVVDMDLPADGCEAAAFARKRLRLVGNREFWAWKLAQPAKHGKPRLTIESWTDRIDIGSIAFDGGPACGVGVSGDFWRDRAKAMANEAGAGYALVMPSSEGVQFSAMLPSSGAEKMANRLSCRLWHPTRS